MSFWNDIKTIQAKKKNTYNAWGKWIVGLTIVGLIGVVCLLTYLSFQDLPTFEELENPNSNLASQIYGSNNELIGRYYIENRVAVTYDDLPKEMVNALIATEDERYYKHSGIDFRSLGRVAFGLLTFSPKGGGSTISQQLAKLLYSDRDFSGMGKLEKTWALATTKLKEWITAVKLERSYTKEEILAMYLNQFNFINGAYGVRAASEIYFGKPQNQLKLEESALLVGMLQNPSLHNPIRRPQNALKRRNVVMGQMLKNNMISQQQFDVSSKKPLDVSGFRRTTHADGIAPYFRMELRKEIQSILDRPENFKPDGSKYNIYRDGLKITTTIDPNMQRHAEEATAAHMKQLQSRFWKTWLGKDPWTSPTSNVDLKTRDASLQKIISESERFQNIKGQYLEETLVKLEEEIEGLLLKDDELDMLGRWENNGGAMPKLIADKTISEERKVVLQRVLKSEHWQTLKKQWTAMQQAIFKSFRTKVKMKVFAYNPKGEKDTIMTPLDSIKYHRMFMQTGILAVDPLTGHIKVWVGGVNHKYFQFDHVRTSRQVGSTFKPFVYATAIMQLGLSPCTQVVDMPYTIRPGEGNFKLIKSWTPNNSTGKYSGKSYTLKEALKESVNTVSVYLMRQLGDVSPVRGLVNLMGIDSTKRRPDGDYRVPKQPSICLGSTDLSVYEMAGAYTTFANNGKYNKPIFLVKIEDKNGRVIYQELPEERQALNPAANYAMVDMLKHVTVGATGFEGLKSEIGGKTGTTNDYVDGWFMGITPRLVVGTWVGGDDKWVRFLTLADGQGARMARPFFSAFIKRLETDPKSGYDYNARFKRPPGDLGIILDCNEYQNKNKPTTTTSDTFFQNEFENK